MEQYGREAMRKTWGLGKVDRPQGTIGTLPKTHPAWGKRYQLCIPIEHLKNAAARVPGRMASRAAPSRLGATFGKGVRHMVVGAG